MDVVTHWYTKNMTKNKTPQTAVISFREGVFYFYPKRVKNGQVRVFNGRNHFMGYAKVVDPQNIMEDVEKWLIKRGMVSL